MNTPLPSPEELQGLLHYRCNDPLEDVLLEYADYCGKSLPEVYAEFEYLSQGGDTRSEKRPSLLELLIAEWQDGEAQARLATMLGASASYVGTDFLDFGAGIGRNCIAFARCGFRTTHVDLFWEGMEFARWRYARRNLQVTCQEANTLPEDRYTLINCQNVCEHIADPVDLLARLTAHLAPGGLLFLSQQLSTRDNSGLKGRLYAGFYDGLLQHLGLESASETEPFTDAYSGNVRVYIGRHTSRKSFSEELSHLRSEAYTYAEKEIRGIRDHVSGEYDRIQSIRQSGEHSAKNIYLRAA